MKKKLPLVLISSLILTSAAYADYGFADPEDFTGEAFFATSIPERPAEASGKSESSHTMPPIKKLRIKLKNKRFEKQQRQLELAPTGDDLYTGEIEESNYASKDAEQVFEDEINDDALDLEEGLAEVSKKEKKKNAKNKKKSKVEPAENIILDCDKVDYDAPNYLIVARGNVSVNFVEQGITVKSDIIAFDRVNNTLKAEGNVRILKNGQTITGEYIFVDMNEESALIEKPVSRSANIEIKSDKGYVYGDRIVQENGSIEVKDSFPIEFDSGRKGPRMRTMMVPKKQTLAEDMENDIIKVDARDIKITQKGTLEMITIKKLKVRKGEKTIFKHPSLSIYTNKNRDFFETGSWELGSYRGLGLYTGPGFVIPMPKGSILKAVPMLNYKSGVGYGVLGRFNSGTNKTMAAYGSANDKIIAYGRQELDDKLYLQYSTYGYMDEWFLGKRRPKYGIGLVYQDGFNTNNFLLKGRTASFMNRLDAGYYHDLDYDNHFEKLQGSHIGTTRFRYMAQGSQSLYSYTNKEKLTAFNLSLVGQLSSALYGTGDTQFIARFGPMVHTQYKRWMQDVGFFWSAMEDNTPFTAFDIYRYGSQNLYLREYFRLCKYLTICWFGSISISNDAANGRDFQENAFYLSIGPDDIKVNLGYDFVRERLYCMMNVMTDAKGSNIKYDKLEVKRSKKAPTEEKVVDKTQQYMAPTSQPALQRAVVENIKVKEDVL